MCGRPCCRPLVLLRWFSDTAPGEVALRPAGGADAGGRRRDDDAEETLFDSTLDLDSRSGDALVARRVRSGECWPPAPLPTLPETDCVSSAATMFSKVLLLRIMIVSNEVSSGRPSTSRRSNSAGFRPARSFVAFVPIGKSGRCRLTPLLGLKIGPLTNAAGARSSLSSKSHDPEPGSIIFFVNEYRLKTRCIVVAASLCP